jgi:hypothetical protein
MRLGSRVVAVRFKERFWEREGVRVQEKAITIITVITATGTCALSIPLRKLVVPLEDAFEVIADVVFAESDASRLRSKHLEGKS